MGGGVSSTARGQAQCGRGSTMGGPRPLGVWVWARLMCAQPLPEGAGAEVGCTGPPRGVSVMERTGREAPIDH